MREESGKKFPAKRITSVHSSSSEELAEAVSMEPQVCRGQNMERRERRGRRGEQSAHHKGSC